MRQSTLPGPGARRSLRKAAAAIALAMAFVASGPISSASAFCLNEAQTPSQLTIQGARDSVLCLINERRAESGLGGLVVNVKLQVAAQHHSKAMNVRNYFGHGSSLTRIKAAGYLGGASSWRIGENLHWGTGAKGSPKAVVSAWMASPGHRSVLLSGFTEVGVGVAKGKPVRGRGRNSAIYTADFGVRH